MGEITMGPFNGRHLTVMFVALVVAAVFVPSSVWAVDQFTNVAVQDPVSGTKAKVDSGRHVLVSDGNGSMTVDGTVTERLATAGNFVHSNTAKAKAANGCIPLLAASGGQAVVIRQIRVNVTADPTPGPADTVVVFTGSTCSTQVARVNPAALGLTVIPLDPGLVFKAPTKLFVSASGGLEADVTADGYRVPATEVP
jgi:hypothetical protein